MKQTFIFIFLFLFHPVFGQNRSIHISPNEWDYRRTQTLSKKIGVDSIQNSSNLWQFRIWAPKHMIEIWEDTTGNTSGKMVTFCKEVVRGDETPTNRVYCETILLTNTTFSQIISLIDSTSIKKMPDSYLIKEWGSGFDGFDYIFETIDTNDYFYKSYWSPSINSTIKEEVIVATFRNRVLDITKAKLIFDNYIQNVPFETFSMGGTGIYQKPYIKGQNTKRKYRRERNRYRRKLKRESAKE